MINKSINDLKRSISLYHVWTHQAYHELSAKYKRTVLGPLWISSGMVANSLALSIVMGVIQGQNLQDALPYVMGGVMCFALVSIILTEAPETYMTSAGIIKNHPYPYSYYTLESVTRNFILFAHNLVVYFITMAILGKLTIPHWSILIAFPLIYVTCVTWCTLASMVAARFRDLRFMLPFLSQIIFFMTPCFWRADNVTGWRSILVYGNPFYGLMEITRSPLLGFSAPMIAWQLSVGALALGVALWLVMFGAFRGKIAFWV
jgi:ABC-type polysaccharide/polyol phosphate export permease